MNKTFRCIEKQLAAQRVRLPHYFEGQEWIRQRVVEPASDIIFGSPIQLLQSTSEEEQRGDRNSKSRQSLYMLPDATVSGTKHHMVNMSSASQGAESAGALTKKCSSPVVQASPVKGASGLTDRPNYRRIATLSEAGSVGGLEQRNSSPMILTRPPMALTRPAEVTSGLIDMPNYQRVTTLSSNYAHSESKGPPTDYTATRKNSRWRNHLASARKASQHMLHLQGGRETKCLSFKETEGLEGPPPSVLSKLCNPSPVRDYQLPQIFVDSGYSSQETEGLEGPLPPVLPKPCRPSPVRDYQISPIFIDSGYNSSESFFERSYDELASPSSPPATWQDLCGHHTT